MLEKAIIFATEAHSGQLRRGQINGLKIPFIIHPLDVMKTLWRWGTSTEDILVAAILHDVVEDTPISLFMIRKEFGVEVASIVDELTFMEPLDKKMKDEAKAKYIETFATKSVEALVCKMADRICNVRDRILTKQQDIALGYYQKAKPLIETFHKRFGEISKRFGETAAQNVNYARLELEEDLGL